MSQDRRAITNLFREVSLGSPENAVGFVMWRVLHRYVRQVDRALAPTGLTHLQFTTLALVAWLGRDGEPTTQSDLARFGDIQPMQVSLMLKALEEKGLIQRSRSEADVRTKLVAVAAAGLRTLRRALPRVIEVQRQLFGREGLPGGSLLSALLEVEKRDDR